MENSPDKHIPPFKTNKKLLMLFTVERVNGGHNLSQSSVEAQQLFKGWLQQSAQDQSNYYIKHKCLAAVLKQ